MCAQQQALKIKIGQTTMEFAIVFVAFVVALLMMRPYMKGAVAGKVKSMSDSAFGGQYDPRLGSHATLMKAVGTTTSKSSIVKAEKRADRNDTAWYVVSYQASGPLGAANETGVLYKDVYGQTVIDNNASRKASGSVSAEYSEYTWKEMGGT